MTHLFSVSTATASLPDTYAIYDFVQSQKPASCAVIGAGFIGLEMAENLAEQGIRHGNGCGNAPSRRIPLIIYKEEKAERILF